MEIGFYNKSPRRSSRRTLTDKEIILLIRAGKINQYEHLIRRYSQRLYRVCGCFDIHSQEAERVIQLTFMTAYRQLFNYHLSFQFSQWLMSIHINVCKEYSNIYLVKPERISSLCEAEDQVMQLTLRDRLVWALRDIEYLFNSDISYLTGLPEINIKMRLLRVRMQLRKHLKDVNIKSSIFFLNEERWHYIAFKVMNELKQLKLSFAE